jgi:hypothetical protein
MKKKKYRAALGRFEGILQKYPNSGLEAKIQKLIIKCRAEISKEEKDRQALNDPADEKIRNDERKSLRSRATIFGNLTV